MINLSHRNFVKLALIYIIFVKQYQLFFDSKNKLRSGHTPKYGDWYFFRIVHPFLNYPVPSTYQCFNFDPYPSRTRSCVNKKHPYPYQGMFILLRFRIPVPVSVLKYQLKLSNVMIQIVFPAH